MKLIFSKLLGLSILIILVNSCAHRNLEADLIIHNAQIYSLDETNRIVEAIAIKDGQIIDLGPERQILNKYNAKKIVDAQMKPVYPGFIDAHCHFIGYALTLNKVNLVGTTSYNEVVDRVIDFSNESDSTWITGRGWDQTKWEKSKYPNKRVLDSLFPNTPILLRRIDGHAALANQKALDIANITEQTQMLNGQILTENGQLTGVLIDGAVDLILKFIPEVSNKKKRDAILLAQKNCLEVGLTTVDDAGVTKSDVFLLDSLHNNDELKLKIYAMLTDSDENFDFFLKNGPYKTDKLTVNSFKLYGDGALGSRGAALLEPYSDIHEHNGVFMNTKEYYREKANLIYNANFQLNTHCIGDSANRFFLDLYGSILKGENDRKWRIEHAQVVDSTDIHKFAKYSIIPSVQPTHAISDMEWIEKRLGEKRSKSAYAYKDLLDQIGIIALGTDFPVESINPIKTFYSAVFRQDSKFEPKQGFQMDNSLTREEALKGMTIWAAIANNEYLEKGSIEVGKNADIIILDHDILLIPKEKILSTEVLYTIIDGEIVYKR